MSSLAASIERIQKWLRPGNVFAQAMLHSPLPGAIADPALAGEPIVFANDALVSMSGRRQEEVIGNPIEASLTSTDKLQMCRMRSKLAAGHSAIAEFSGQETASTSVLLTGYPIRHEEEPLYFYSMFTHRRASSVRAEQQLRLLVEKWTNEAVYTLDASGKIMTWNAGAEKTFGYSAEQVIGKHVSLLYLEGAVANKDLERAEREGTLETEGSRRRTDRTTFPAYIVIDALRDETGTLVGYFSVTRDISAETRAREAERASEAKTEFLTSMSHEIRTPLHGIIGYTDRLLDEALTADQRRYAERIQTAGSALLTIINDILDLSRIEAGNAELDEHPFSLASLADNSVSIVSATADKKGLSVRLVLEPGLPKIVIGDEARIRQVLLNLLNNAIKFTHEGHILLSVSSILASGQYWRVRFSVEDTGIGIPENKRERLFKRFSQIDSSIRREFGGTGLGLVISKTLIDLMGGQIGMESQEGRGSIFWFLVTLPVATTQDIVSATETDLPRARPARILLAEDLEVNQELTRAVLEMDGHSVDVVANGAGAVTAAKAARYDLILMDIQMPVMDGIAATRAIRALPPPASETPIIAMTANVLSQQVRLFKDAGMSDYIGKPMRRGELPSLLRRWLPSEIPLPRLGTDCQTSPLQNAEIFDRAAFDSLRELIGPQRVAEWFGALIKDLSSMPIDGGPSSGTDSDTLRKRTHILVSRAGNFGFFELASACASLEEACSSGADYAKDLERVHQAARRAQLVAAKLLDELER